MRFRIRAYKDLNHRAEARVAAADPDWKEFRDGLDRLEEMHVYTALEPLAEAGTLTLVHKTSKGL